MKGDIVPLKKIGSTWSVDLGPLTQEEKAYVQAGVDAMNANEQRKRMWRINEMYLYGTQGITPDEYRAWCAWRQRGMQNAYASTYEPPVLTVPKATWTARAWESVVMWWRRRP